MRIRRTLSSPALKSVWRVAWRVRQAIQFSTSSSRRRSLLDGKWQEKRLPRRHNRLVHLTHQMRACTVDAGWVFALGSLERLRSNEAWIAPPDSGRDQIVLTESASNAPAPEEISPESLWDEQREQAHLRADIPITTVLVVRPPQGALRAPEDDEVSFVGLRSSVALHRRSAERVGWVEQHPLRGTCLLELQLPCRRRTVQKRPLARGGAVENQEQRACRAFAQNGASQQWNSATTSLQQLSTRRRRAAAASRNATHP